MADFADSDFGILTSLDLSTISDPDSDLASDILDAQIAWNDEAGEEYGGDVKDFDEEQAEAAANRKPSSLFSTDELMDRTAVIPLGSGETYLQLTMKPPEGYGNGKQINNAKSHSGGLTALITGINISNAGRTQLMNTLGKDVYMYTFGDGVYEISLSGFGFRPCGDEAKTDISESLLEFFDHCNVGTHGKHCTVQLGDRIFYAYLVSSEVGLSSQNPGMVAFEATFYAMDSRG